MFVLTENPTFSHPVKVLIPVDGGHKEQSFTAEFRVIPAEEAAKFDLNKGEDSRAFLQRAIVKFGDDIVGPDDKPVPYSDELRDRLIGVPYVRSALARTYFAAIGGQKLGN